ncbi:hypothetical protein BC939DRAFT_453042 [Gamsiella multidivaricata]|uniref:uncharacterized protein n=1 Tax=Gamsiella multidivaricata TaxID=101098 RepID=UPI00222057A6|nr:uncharacterized protein BC939DRAFT_453042 [Gamsiella multidivaricata]KAI7822930.1 hypothetical protein BC939DRAFT_453042 [Gamsiella multidivaricata]
MKFTILAASAVAMLASLVSVKSDPASCTLCLQKALQTLPACANIQPTPGSVSSAFATCLCASVTNTSWINSCSGASDCGSAISTFKVSYGASIIAAGLHCSGSGSPSFAPSA